MGRVIKFDRPVEAGLSCRHCHQPLAALGVIPQSLAIQGLRVYEWAHAVTGLSTCTRVTPAEPSDGWHATAVIEGALAARRALEDATEAALAAGSEEKGEGK